MAQNPDGTVKLPKILCPFCKGEGKEIQPSLYYDAEEDAYVEEDCPQCNGSGLYENEPEVHFFGGDEE